MRSWRAEPAEAPAPAAPAVGLSEAEAARRLAASPPAPAESSRSYASIVRANVFTLFNAILLVAGIATLVFGNWQDALFLAILVGNSAIGIGQEVRAKRALDRLAALVAPTGTVERDGTARSVPAEQVVVGDLVRIGAGDQVVADGRLERASGLGLDESVLTGESHAVTRGRGDAVRSGSFVAEGDGAYRVTAVGAASYAGAIVGQARTFRHPRSPLERALNRLLLALVAVMVPLGLLIGAALWRRDAPLSQAVPTSVAAVVTLVPEGLILLASLTYAVAGLRMARRGALAQQLNAVESLASVNVICLDKTGTLTEPTLRVVELVPAEPGGEAELAHALSLYAAGSASRNATLTALAEAYPTASPPRVGASVPFASRRRWGALEVDGSAYLLGAPELFPLGALAAKGEREAAAGRRVVAFARTAARLHDVDADAGLPGPLVPLGLAVLAEQLRPDAAGAVAFFRSQGVELKLLSGDRPQTVAAIARDSGIVLRGPPVDGSELPRDRGELRRLALESTVIGRVSPEGKRRVIEALTGAGLYVAMIGDGVNDVPALKAARLAIAQGSGTQMARAVADVVLVRGDFAALPAMVAEGRKVLRNLQRVAKLFVTKSAFAAFLILSIGLTTAAYPLLPRHLTLAAGLTIGIPSFFLALAPSSGHYEQRGFLRGVARFAVPAGTAAGLGVVSTYLFSLNVLGRGLLEARTVATTVLVGVGLYLIVALEASGRRRGAAVGALALALAALYVLVLATPIGRSFFELAPPRPSVIAPALVGIGVAIAGLWLTDPSFVPSGRRADE